MNKMTLIAWIGTLLTTCCSCNDNLIEYKQNDLKIDIEQGEAWLHDFPLFMGIKTKNRPQIAIWMEDTTGNYLSTIYVTYRIATQSWRMADGNRRKEALPHWCHSRGVQYADGLYLPTKGTPLTDAITGATPQGSFEVKMTPINQHPQKFIIKVEVNHSTDFNDAYPKNAQKSDANYSGGEKGSGQPAVIYAAHVDLTTDTKTFEATLIGHSSPDGSDGNIIPDVSDLTTALQIIKCITVKVQE